MIAALLGSEPLCGLYGRGNVQPSVPISQAEPIHPLSELVGVLVVDLHCGIAQNRAYVGLAKVRACGEHKRYRCRYGRRGSRCAAKGLFIAVETKRPQSKGASSRNQITQRFALVHR
jgi:hypothetical protein